MTPQFQRQKPTATVSTCHCRACCPEQTVYADHSEPILVEDTPQDFPVTSATDTANALPQLPSSPPSGPLVVQRSLTASPPAHLPAEIQLAANAPSRGMSPVPEVIDYDLPFGLDPSDYALPVGTPPRPASPSIETAPGIPDAPRSEFGPLDPLNPLDAAPSLLDAPNPLDTPNPLDAPGSPRADDPPPPARLVQGVDDLPARASELLAESSNIWFWRIIMLLGSWVHLHYQLPHRGVTLMLQVMRLVLLTLGAIPPDDDRTPTTLRTTFARLALQDNFDIRAMCPQCARLFSAENDAVTETCNKCKIPLFKNTAGLPPVLASEAEETRIPASRTPLKQVPCSLLSSQLVDMVPRLEDSLDRWREMPPPHDGVLRSIQDGEIWKTLPGPPGDSKPFFYNGPDREDESELRIGVTLAFNGFIISYQSLRYYRLT